MSNIIESPISINRIGEAIPGELKHLSILRKRKRHSPLCGVYSLSSGERTGNSLNLGGAIGRIRFHQEVAGFDRSSIRTAGLVIKLFW